MRMGPAFLENSALRLLLFGGKGGTGKTTCAAAAALRRARRNPRGRYLLVSTDPAHSLSDSLGDAPRPGNLEVEELDAGAALEAFRRRHAAELHEIASRGTFFSDGQIRSLLELSLPGLDELMAFLEIAERSQSGEWASILVDTAPTGHTLRLLEMPDVLGAWLAALDTLLAKHRYLRRVFAHETAPDHLDRFLEAVSRRVAEGKALLSNAEGCRFVPVMLAERLSVRETEGLIRALGKLAVPVEEIVVNRLYPAECAVAQAQREELNRVLERESWSALRLWGVPMYPNEVRGAALGGFWDGARPLEAEPDLRPARTAGEWRVEGPAELPAPDLRLLIVGGKGGVGKTTIACAVALAAAREDPERRILLFSTDPAHSLGDCLDLEVGPRPVPVAAGLAAVELDAIQEFEALKEQYGAEIERLFAKLSQRFELVFDRQAMEGLLDLAPPGLDEVMCLCRISELLEARRYDTVILDSAATGHLLRLLELPALAQDWLRVLFSILLDQQPLFRLPEFTAGLVGLSRNVKQLRKRLADAGQAQLWAVTIPTEMAIEETADLLAACDRMNIATPALFVNQVTGRGDCGLCTALRQREAACLEKLRQRFGGGRRLTLVERGSEPRGLEALGRAGLFQEAGRLSWAAR
jgi:arsenite-transporting ATPase